MDCKNINYRKIFKIIKSSLFLNKPTQNKPHAIVIFGLSKSNKTITIEKILNKYINQYVNLNIDKIKKQLLKNRGKGELTKNLKVGAVIKITNCNELAKEIFYKLFTTAIKKKYNVIINTDFIDTNILFSLLKYNYNVDFIYVVSKEKTNKQIHNKVKFRLPILTNTFANGGIVVCYLNRENIPSFVNKKRITNFDDFTCVSYYTRELGILELKKLII